MHIAGRAVDNHRIVRFDEAGDVGNKPDRGDSERARDDRHMARRPALLEDQPAQFRAVIVEQRRRPHVAGDDDRVLRDAVAVGDIALARQLVQQAVGEIVEIVQPITQIRIGLALHSRPGVVLHPLDRGLGGKAGHRRLAQPAQPSLVIGDHADRFEHVPMLAGAHAVSVSDEFVDRYPHRVYRRVETPQFPLNVLGEQVLHDDARLVQQHIAEPNAFADRRALERQRTVEREQFGRLGDGLQFARGDHFGEQHRRGLQRLDFFLGIGAPHLVLHDQHADRIAAAQNRHAEEGVIDLLAGLRTIGESRMLMRLGQGERLRALRDQADQALAGLHGGQMNRLAVQALGGVKFKPLVGAQDIDRTHLRHHIGGDLHHDLVEPRLCVHRLRADFAQPAQQQAWSAVNAPHRVYSCSTAAWRTPPTHIYYYYIPARSLATRPWPAYIAALRPPQGSGVRRNCLARTIPAGGAKR